MGTVGMREGRERGGWGRGAAEAVGVGGALCLVQYFANGTYWVDELAIVRNIVDRPLAALLLRPLDYDQVAPSGFLLVQHLLERTFGTGELVLRAYALVMAFIALAAVLHIGRRLLPGRAAVVPALVLGVSGQFHWLSSQVKPYSGDVAMIAVLLALALSVEQWREWTLARRLALAIGAVAPWFAQPALFAIPSLALAVLWHDVTRNRRVPRWTVGAVLFWGVSALLSLLAARARVDAATMSFMRAFWRGGFAPIPPTSWSDLKWPGYVLRSVVADLSNQQWSYAYFAVAVVGAVTLWRRSRRDLVLLLAPLALAFVASALRQYPLAHRLAFFLAPIVAVLIGGGFAALLPSSVSGSTRFAWGAILAFMAPSAWGLVRNPPPYEMQPVRPLLTVIRDQLRPGDRAYVHYASWQAWMHYAPRLGIDSLPLVLGSCHYQNSRAYDDEIRALAGGGRTWILFVGAGWRDDPAELERVADTIGRRLLSQGRSARTVEGTPSEVKLLLYDFGTSGSASPVVVQDEKSPPPLPPQPSDDSCRGAAVPRRDG